MNYELRLPASPLLSWAAFTGGRRTIPSVLEAGPALLLTSGRAALGLALTLMALKPGDQVLLPAYHSVSVSAPVRWAGAECVFYRIHPDTSPDLTDLAQRIGPRTRLVIAVHYFGFPQPLGALRDLCRERGILLLEDCAHTLFGRSEDAPVGHSGDYAIASLMKFYPVFDGGALVSARHDLSAVPVRRDSGSFELKAACNTLERALHWQRLRPLPLLLAPLLGIKQRLWQTLKRRTLAAPRSSPASEGGSAFDPGWIDKTMSLTSRAVLHSVSAERIAVRRRAHYQRLLDAVAGLPGGRPLFDRLPDTAVPYLFPLYLERPDTVLPILRRYGIPILHFAEQLPAAATAVCPVSADLSRRLIQLPCHQELTADELQQLCTGVRAAL